MKQYGKYIYALFSLITVISLSAVMLFSAGAEAPAIQYTLDDTAETISWVAADSLGAAVDSLKDAAHGRIELHGNVTMDKDLTVSSGTITLELGSWTVDFGTAYRLTISGGNVIICSSSAVGTLTSAYSGDGHFLTVDGGSLTMESGNIAYTGTNSDYENAAVCLKNGNFTMTGGKVTSSGRYSLYLMDTAAISGGTVVNTGSEGDALYCSTQSTSITGGVFSSTDGYALYDSSTSQSSKVKGGYYYSDNEDAWSDNAKAASGFHLSTSAESDGDYEGFYMVYPTKYTVIWKIGSTKAETDADILYGETAAYNGTAPTKAASGTTVYTFLGWNTDPDAETALSAIPPVTEDQTYYAIFAAGAVSYTVTWMLDTAAVETDTGVTSGATPTYDGATPVKAATKQYSYAFLGWNTDAKANAALTTLPAVTGDTTYYAIFSQDVNVFSVTWVINGTAVETDKGIPYGSAPTFNGEAPTKEGDNHITYTFAGWAVSEDAGSGTNTSSLPSLSGDTIYYAIFSSTEAPSHNLWWIALFIAGSLMAVLAIAFLIFQNTRHRNSALFN